ncbi:DNA-processing protein DprA [Thermocrinis sp.]|uniref:DNA-processing protein DprA n=1 Tax=Thermocrinis sp. TaxID=2024383 RepID=UPI003BFFFF49
MKESLYWWLALKSVAGLGERSIKKLYQAFKDPKVVFEADQWKLKALVGDAKAQAIKEKKFSFEPEEVIKVVEREGINYVCLSDPQYPVRLKEIEDPPPVLFYRGELKTVSCFGVVGTRNPDSYSVRYTKELVGFLVGKGYAIVSGGAKGIDAYAHKFCIEAGGYTLCLLGMGILEVPQRMQDFILRSGVLLSELLPWEKADKHTFPRRNRLISGISEGVFIVEAGENSGALITAYYAKEQNRPVYVHVGYGISERWEGCIKLVNEGVAKLVGRVEKFGLKGEVQEEDPLLMALNTPKTLSELSQLLGMDERELHQKLVFYELEDLITRSGSYYIRLKQEWDEYQTHQQLFPSFEEI